MDVKLLSTTSLSGSTSHSITAFTSEYTLYGFTFSGVQGDGGNFVMRFNEGGAAASGASDYSFFRRIGTNSTDWVDSHSNSADSFMYLDWTNILTNANTSGFGFIYGSQNSGRFTTMAMKGVMGTTSTLYHSYNTGRLEKNSIVDGVTIFSDSSQNFTNGKFSIYGYK